MSKTNMAMRMPIPLSLTLMFFLSVAAAQGASPRSCGDGAGARPAAAAPATASPATASLSRQLQASRALHRSRGCGTGGSPGGLFDGCRDLGARIAGIEARIAAAAPASARTARCASPSSAASRRKARREADARPQSERFSRGYASHGSDPIETMCVRLADGYFFPSPNSGYLSASDEPRILSQCRLICQTSEMAVYRVSGEERLSEDMVALKDGSPYIALAAVRHARRSAAERPRCDMSRYLQRVAEIEKRSQPAGRARSEDRQWTRVSFIAVPSPRPAMAAVAASASLSAGSVVASRAVRMVGVPFLPQ